jgi:hypothetical protein
MEEDKQKNQNTKYDILKWIILGLIIIIAVIFIFGVGIFVGEKKASFSYRWAEQYHKNFAGPPGGFFENWQKFPGSDFIGAHGVFGQIIKINDSSIIIKGSDNVEKIVLIKDDTIIERFRETIKITDLKVDDFVVVIGDPNDTGQIEAKFIRVLPAPSETTFNIFLPRLGGPKF